MEFDLSKYVNPSYIERIPFAEISTMQVGDKMRLHTGEIRAYVSLDHHGIDNHHPFVKLEMVAWTRNRDFYTEGKVIEVDSMNLFSMPKTS